MDVKKRRTVLPLSEEGRYWAVRLAIIIGVAGGFLILRGNMDAALALIYVLTAITITHLSKWPKETTVEIVVITIGIIFAGGAAKGFGTLHPITVSLIFGDIFLLIMLIHRYPLRRK